MSTKSLYRVNSLSATLLHYFPLPCGMSTKSHYRVNSGQTTSEAWNHRIEQLCGVQKLIWWLKRDAALSSTHILSNSRGDSPRRRIKRVYCRLHARLLQLCRDRQDRSKSVEEFLRGAGHNIRWKPGPGNDIH
ncbi:hypothetical protein ACOMHN_041260 [Nucella lapillus]